MAFAFVQDDFNTGDASATVLTVVMGLGVTIDNLMVVCSRWETTDTTCTITDTRGSTWIEIPGGHPINGGILVAMHYAIVPSTGANTITQTFGAARTFRSVSCSEYSGGLTSAIDILGKSTQFAFTEANPSSALEVLTTAELGVATGANAGGTTYAPGSGWVERMEPYTDNQIQDAISPSLGTFLAAWTAANDQHVHKWALFRSQLPSPPAGGGQLVGVTQSRFRTRYRRY